MFFSTTTQHSSIKVKKKPAISSQFYRISFSDRTVYARIRCEQTTPFKLLKLLQSQEEITCFRISETWRKHATPCFRYVYVKVVRFRCIRSNGNARKRHKTGNGNTGYPSCFRNGLTCFCHVSVYGFLQFRPVNRSLLLLMRINIGTKRHNNSGDYCAQSQK